MSGDKENSPSERKKALPEHPDQDLGIVFPYIPTDGPYDRSEDRTGWWWTDGSSVYISESDAWSIGP